VSKLKIKGSLSNNREKKKIRWAQKPVPILLNPRKWTLSPVLIQREVHSSMFKRESRIRLRSSPRNNLENDTLNILPIPRFGVLKKKPTINISHFKTNINEEKISKNIEIGTAALKNIPNLEMIGTKEKTLNEKLNSSKQIRSGEVLSLNSLNPIRSSSREVIFKSPQLSPVMESAISKRRAYFDSLAPLNKYLYTSLALKPNNFEEVHSALGHSINRMERVKLESLDEPDEKILFQNLEKSSCFEVKSDFWEEEIKDQEQFPDETDFINRATMEKSWDYKCKNMDNDRLPKENQPDIEDIKELDEKNALKLNRFSLYFEKGGDEAIENFYENLFSIHKKENLIMLVFIWVIFIYDCWSKKKSYFQIEIILRSLFLFAFVFLIKYFTKLFERKILRKILIITYLLINFLILCPVITHSKTMSLLELSKILLIKVFFQNISIILFSDVLVLSIILLGLLIFFKIPTVLQFLILLFIILIHLFSARKNLLRNISKYNLKIANSVKKTQQKTLVRHLLPNHIQRQFIDKPSAKSDLIEEFEDVTILFADIKGFTDFSVHNQASVVVNMLRDLFTEFDKLCLKNDVYKLYTIGDCYVALGLIDANERNPEEEARNVLQFAFELINAIKSVRKKNPELEMRIGIHIVFFIINI